MKGELILTNLPLTIQTLDIYRRRLFMNLTAFPNLSQSYNLTHLRITTNYQFSSRTYGKVSNLQSKLPSSIQYLRLDNFNLDRFPNFVNFTQLIELHFYYIGNIVDHYSFVSSQIPSKLQRISIYFSDVGFKGILNFTQLITDSNHNEHDNNLNESVVIRNYSVGLKEVYMTNVNFDSVDFRGVGRTTQISLDQRVPCAVESLYRFTTQDYICTRRLKRQCTGEENCLDTCQCFKLPDDWQPSLNDFYTYVIIIFIHNYVLSDLPFNISRFWYAIQHTTKRFDGCQVMR